MDRMIFTALNGLCNLRDAQSVSAQNLSNQNVPGFRRDLVNAGPTKFLTELNSLTGRAFQTHTNWLQLRPGDVVKVADASRGGMRLGGRIAAATTVSVTLDQDLPAGSWRISVVLPTGVVEERQVGSLSGRTVGVTSAFSMAPQVGAIWVLSSTLVEAQLFRVVQVAESEPGIHEITALAHNPSKYAAIEQGLALQPRAITVLSTTPAAPTGLTVTESLYRDRKSVV